MGIGEALIGDLELTQALILFLHGDRNNEAFYFKKFLDAKGMLSVARFVIYPYISVVAISNTPEKRVCIWSWFSATTDGECKIPVGGEATENQLHI